MGKSKGAKGAIRFDLRKLLLNGFVRFTTSLLPYAVTVAFAGLLFGSSYAFALQSDLFTLKEVSLQNGKRLSPQAAASYTGLRVGEKILSIDLGRIERYIRARNPEFKDVLVRRILPDEIRIELRRRVPLAQIEQDGVYYLLDSDAYVIADPIKEIYPSMPLLKGSRIAKGDLRKGARLNRNSLNQGIQLLRDMRSFNVLKGHRLTTLDISDANNFVMWIDEKVEIRIAARNFTSQLQKISDALVTLDLDPERIAYIDLRFDDIVIGQK